MPTYEFRCPSGHDFERFFRTISGAPSEFPCPECGQIAARRVSGGAGLLFKGSGFYITDYGKDGKKGMTPPQKPGESGGGDGGASKPDAGGGTEAKPAAAKETAKSEPAPPKKPKPPTE